MNENKKAEIIINKMNKQIPLTYEENKFMFRYTGKAISLLGAQIALDVIKKVLEKTEDDENTKIVRSVNASLI